MNDHTTRRILRDLALLAEQTHHLIEQVSADAGFYVKRAGDLIPGDEIRLMTGPGWTLVVGVEPSASREGEGVCTLTLDVGTEEDEDWKGSFDPQEWVDVKALSNLDGRLGIRHFTRGGPRWKATTVWSDVRLT